jgi:hypothetical protein
MEAKIQLQDNFMSGEVLSVASTTKPTGWWNGNVVKYDTVIQLTEHRADLKPGMSVAVEVFLARYNDVLKIPVAAVIQQGDEFLCWVETDNGVVKRSLRLGGSNEQFIVVENGLLVGEQVVLNPLDFIDEAQIDALKPIDNVKRSKPGAESAADNRPVTKKVATDKKPTGANIVPAADKSGEGGLKRVSEGSADSRKK